MARICLKGPKNILASSAPVWVCNSPQLNGQGADKHQKFDVILSKLVHGWQTAWHPVIGSDKPVTALEDCPVWGLKTNTEKAGKMGTSDATRSLSSASNHLHHCHISWSQGCEVIQTSGPSTMFSKVLYQTTCVEYLTAVYIVSAEIKQSLQELLQVACLRCVTTSQHIHCVYRCKEEDSGSILTNKVDLTGADYSNEASPREYARSHFFSCGQQTEEDKGRVNGSEADGCVVIKDTKLRQ
ncbi:hypothetical protein PAMP_011215 [Pampus punctatissimus]